MSGDVGLAERMDAALAAAQEKAAQQRQQHVQRFQERQQRLAALDSLFNDLREIWQPRLEVLASRFADQVDVTPDIAVGSRRVTFAFQSELARVTLRFSAHADEDVRNVIFQYDLEILPILMSFDSHSELRFPLDDIDRDGLARWIDERIMSFVRTYLGLQQNHYYLQGHLVEDPVAKVRFPKFAAGAKLDWNGKTIYFIGEETRQQFEQQQAVQSK